MAASGGTNIQIQPITSPQECFNKCLAKKLEGDTEINGVSVDDLFAPKTCYCHRNQEKTQTSVEEWNCLMKSYKKGFILFSHAGSITL